MTDNIDANGAIPNEAIEVTEIELADWLGLTDRRIRQLAKDGIVAKSRRGRYDLKASIKGYVNWIRQDEKKMDASLDKLKLSKEATALQHEQLKKRKTELQVQELEKKLHRAEDVEYFWNVMALAVKSRLTAIPVKCAPLLVGIDDRKEIQAILKREVTEALNEVAEYSVDQYTANLEDDGEDAE